MLSTWTKPTCRISFAVLLCVGGLQSIAAAWQFRDLDGSTPAPIEEGPADLIDLIPTDQAFLAPAVDTPQDLPPIAAPSAGSGSPQEVTATTEIPAVDVAKPAKSTTPPAAKRPEPVPMPELGVGDAPKPSDRGKHDHDVETTDPLRAFTKHLKPIPAQGAQAATYKDVQVGLTTEKELREKWGDPVRVLKHEDAKQTWIFQVAAFKQIDVAVDNDVVSSLVFHLDQPLDAGEVAKKLDLTQFSSVPVTDEYGEVLGQAYPERGVLFGLTEGLEKDVSVVVCEPLSGEMFRLRAQHADPHFFERSLADLKQALRLDPADAESLWLQAEYQDATGRTADAVSSIEKAIRLKPTNAMYRISRARLYAKTKRLTKALLEIRSVIAEIDMSNELAGYAHNTLGDLLALGPQADHHEALQSHLKAIDLASKSLKDRRFVARRLAKKVLVTAHLSVARDIALGNFQRQVEVVPKWLLRATEMADEFISADHGEELLQMQLFRDTLACYSELRQGTFDVAVATEEAMRVGRSMISAAEDELYKTNIERMLAETLVYAAKIHRSRGKHQTALQFANNALALLESSGPTWENTPHDDYLMGELYFTVGSIHALRDQDHVEAVQWYTKARTEFADSNFVTPLYSNRNHGEMFVSMGLSLWETGQRELGLAVTRSGAELMKDAVEAGALELHAMSVPYGNLAAMFDNMGEADKSKQFTELVAQVEDTTSMKR